MPRLQRARCSTERFRALDARVCRRTRTACTTRSRPIRRWRVVRAPAAARRARADANSGGEIEVALRAGFTPDQISSSPASARRSAELERAVALGVRGHQRRVVRRDRAHRRHRARPTGREARIAVRINPDVDAGSHPHISTGSRATKFGVSLDEARAMIRDMARRPGLQLVGLHVHVGSQITTSRAARPRGAASSRDLARELIGRRASRSSTSTSAAGWASPYEPGQPVDVARGLRGGRAAGRARHRADASCSSPADGLSGRPASSLTEVVDLKRAAGGGCVRHRRCGHDRPDAAGALRRVARASSPSRPAPGAASPSTSSDPSARRPTRSAAGAASAAGRGRRSARDSRHRRLRRGHGVELQSPTDGRRGDGRAAALARHPAPADVDDMLQWDDADADRVRRTRPERQGNAGAAPARAAASRTAASVRAVVVSGLRHADRPGDRDRRSPASATSART